MLTKVTPEIAKMLLPKEVYNKLGKDGIEAILTHLDEVYHYAGEMPIFDEEDFIKWSRYNSIIDAAEAKNMIYSDCVIDTRALYEGPYWNDMSEEEKDEAVIDYMRERLIDSEECLVLDSGAVLIV